MKDYNFLAARYIWWLGVLNLLGLNIAGLILIWFGKEIERRDNRFRRFYIFWTLIVSPILVVLFLGLADFTTGTTMRIYFTEMDVPVWFGYFFLLLVLVVYGLPATWLCRKDVRYQYTSNQTAHATG